MKSIRNYIKDDDLKIIIYKNKIDIQNYTDIESISEKEIIISVDSKIVKVSGSKLKVEKLLSSEILIFGNINNINFEGINE